MNMVKLSLLLMAIFIAMAFVFSCSSGDDNNNDGPDVGGGNSSSSQGSSSSVTEGIGTSSSSSAITGEGSSSSSVVGGSSSSGGGKGNVPYEGKTYETVEIGGKVWMAENLNYAVSDSKCGGADGLLKDENTENCDKYGRLYDWATAMNLSANCNSSTCSGQIQPKHRGICPEGWHIPSNAEWDELYRAADGTSGTSSPYNSPTAGKHLKAKEGWNSCGPSGSGESYSCEDTHGFAALPGGNGYSDGDFRGAGNYGLWWSSSEYGSSYAYDRGMGYGSEYASWDYIGKYYLFSVRCLQD